MSNCCLRTHCIQCCKQTNMLLTNRDVETITTLGYDRTYFVDRRNGWLQLKNSQGRCVFHTGEICGIYDHRPEGCMLYPVVYDNDTHCAIIDSECLQQHMFSLEKHNVHKLIKLIAMLRRERTQRKNTPLYKKKTT